MNGLFQGLNGRKCCADAGEKSPSQAERAPELNFFALSEMSGAAVTLPMNDFTDALMLALRSGQEDPTASHLGQRMKALVAEIANPAIAKTQRTRLTRELARVREAYRSNLMSR